MPLRWPKMYCFIFGFQRFVWCPKWTPASRRSFIETATKTLPPRGVAPLALGILEPLACPGLAVLLALLRAGVTGQKPLGLQTLAEFGIVVEQRPRDAEPDRSGLARDAAAFDVHEDV